MSLFAGSQSTFGQSQAATQQPQGGLFGNTQQNSGGGLFGNTNQQQQPQQPSGGLFGQQQQQPAPGNSLFGQPQQQQQPQQQGASLFGQQLQQQQQPQNAGLFGQSTLGQGGSMFGGQQQQQQQQPTGGFGMSQMGMSGMNQQMTMIQTQTNPIVEKISRVKNSWDSNHPDYAFRYYFFNHIGKERAALYQKPPQEDSAAWEKAWSERPNDSCVPVRANGFRELDLRVRTQENQVQVFRGELWAIQEKLNRIQSQHDLSTSIKLEDCRRRHLALARRALSLAAKVQVLKNRGYALQPEEEQLKKRLDALTKAVSDPASYGRMNEIWARMMVVQEKAKLMEESLGKVDIVWDEKQLQTAGKLLQSNAAGLEHLHKEVKDIERSFEQWVEKKA
ncbi:nucleoporin complex subunit 54-domain-containing protein [Geopyxis carbonaria]|nr:nucleoporin complex subunit 54-domain-containing protein [Geopyxis carbonaria]